jgi:hypothetical protein
VGRLRDRPTLFNLDKASELAAGSWVCSTDKARRDLAFAPLRPLLERLRETADSYAGRLG